MQLHHFQNYKKIMDKTLRFSKKDFDSLLIETSKVIFFEVYRWSYTVEQGCKTVKDHFCAFFPIYVKGWFLIFFLSYLHVYQTNPN